MNPNISQEELILIDQFLNNELEGEQLRQFRDMLESNPDMEARISEIRLLRLGIREAGLRAEIAQIHHKQFGAVNKAGKSRFSFSFGWNIGIAATLLLLIGLGIFFTIHQQSKNNLYALYFKPDPGLMTTMGAESQYEFQRAMVDYKEGKYREAIVAWEKQMDTKSRNDTLSYFTGVAYLALGDQLKAQSYLKPITGDPDGNFYKEANWYLGLSLIKSRKFKEAIPFISASRFKQSESLVSALKKK